MVRCSSVATILRVYGHHVQDDLRKAVNSAASKSAELVPNILNGKRNSKGIKFIQNSV